MGNYIPHNTTKLFSDIWSDASSFLTDWKACGLYQAGLVEDTNITTLYYLLYAKYGNSAICCWDEEQFKYKVYSTIFQYGPTWEKKLTVQGIIRGLTESDLLTGSKAINNHAFNPSQEPSTTSLEEIDTINDQAVQTFKKGKLEGYNLLVELLEDNISKDFVDKFSNLFAKFVYTRPDLYITED